MGNSFSVPLFLEHGNDTVLETPRACLVLIHVQFPSAPCQHCFLLKSLSPKKKKEKEKKKKKTHHHKSILDNIGSRSN